MNNEYLFHDIGRLIIYHILILYKSQVCGDVTGTDRP